MARTEPRGYFGIGIHDYQVEANVGILMRTAYLYKANFGFTIGPRYVRTAADTPNTPTNMPMFTYDDFDDFMGSRPNKAQVIGVELCEESFDLRNFVHPEQAIYMLGSENKGLPNDVLDTCDMVVQIPCLRDQSMNVAVAGSILLYDRFVKGVK